MFGFSLLVIFFVCFGVGSGCLGRLQTDHETRMRRWGVWTPRHRLTTWRVGDWFFLVVGIFSLVVTQIVFHMLKALNG